MKDIVRGKLQAENEALQEASKKQIKSAKGWFEDNKKILSSTSLIAGIIMLIVSGLLKEIRGFAPSLYALMNGIEGHDLISLIEGAGWNITAIGTTLCFVVYIYPPLKAFALRVWRPVRYVLLFIVSLLFFVLELFGVGTKWIRWIRERVPSLRKKTALEPEKAPEKAPEKKVSKDFDAIREKRMNKARSKNLVVPKTVQYIKHGPTFYFETSKEDKAKAKALGEEIKSRFEFACGLYRLDNIGVESVIKGPSATILGCRVGGGFLADLKKREEDIARTMQVDWIKIENGKGIINIVVPCMPEEREYVDFHDVIDNFKPSKENPLEIPLGRMDTGDILTVNIVDGPHWSIAGSTNSGKSTMLQSKINGLLMRHGPETLRFLMIDTKIVELSVYNGIPHLLRPIITDPGKAVQALGEVDKLARKRYEVFSSLGLKNIFGYNKQAKEPLPFVVIVIEELADLMMNRQLKDITEDNIVKLVQFARAAGVYLIFATQRPSVDVVTGLIKTNVPGRLAFSVANSTDSRVALDMTGAEKLLGKGDGLLKMPGISRPVHFQAAYIKDEEIEMIVDHWRNYMPEKKIEDILKPDNTSAKKPQNLDEVPQAIFKSVSQTRVQKERSKPSEEILEPEQSIMEEAEEAPLYEDQNVACSDEKGSVEVVITEEGVEDQVETEADEDEDFTEVVEVETDESLTEILDVYESLDENTLRVGLYVAMIRWRNQYTEMPVLPSTRDMNESIKMKKEVLFGSINTLDESGIVQKSETKGRYATTKILISYEQAICILKHYRPDILNRKM